MLESMSDQIAGGDKRKAGDTIDADDQIAGADKSSGKAGETVDADDLIASGDKSVEMAGQTADAAAAPPSTGAGITSPESESSPSKVQQVERIIKEKTGRRDSLDAVRAKAIQNALILLSAAVAFFILATMWSSRGEAPLHLASVWHISLLICCCCFFWASFLEVAMGARMVFMYLTYALLLAVVAHYAFSPKIGMISVHFVTHLGALSVGYAFAEHWVKTAKKNDIPMPKIDQQANSVQFFFPRMCCVAITICAALRMLWIVYHADDYAENGLLLYVQTPLLGVLILWILYVDVSLDAAVLGQGGMAMVFAYYILIMMLYMLSLITLGNTAAAVTIWIAGLGMSGFFGFYVSIYNSSR